MGYAAVYLWNYEYQFVDFSIPHTRTGITCVAPKPHPLPGWLTPILPFTKTLWLAVGVSIIVTALTFYLISKATNFIPGEFPHILEISHHVEQNTTLLESVRPTFSFEKTW